MIYIFGHQNPDTDTVTSALVMEYIFEKRGQKHGKAVMLGEISEETAFALTYFNVKQPEIVETLPAGSKIFLVDHNEFGQSIKNIAELEITGVVDHHKVAGFETKEPISMRVEAVGCTATILYKIMQEEKIDISKEIAGLMISAIISDTLLLKSPTTTKFDEYVLRQLAKIAQVDENLYGMNLLKAGTNVADKDAAEVVNNDAKFFDLNMGKGFISQVNVVDFMDVKNKKENYITELQKIATENNCEFSLLVVTDILTSNSFGYVVGAKSNEVSQKLDAELVDFEIQLPGVVSRKKQVVPKLS